MVLAPVVVAPEPCVLNPDYTFDRFVPAPSSQLAWTAAQTVATQQSPKLLVIYGGHGYGKTHLLQAIGQACQSGPGCRVRYLTANQFSAELEDAILASRIWHFRTPLEELDVLLLDDFQALAGKARSLAEFFELFNHLYDRGREIVIALDRHPHELTKIEDRMVSRLLGGLVVDLEPPDPECRKEIVRRLASAQALTLDEEAVDFLAKQLTNPHHLRGALSTLRAQCSDGTPVTRVCAESTLPGFLREIAEARSPQKVLHAVADHFGLTVDDLKSHRRPRQISRPRQMGMWLMRRICEQQGRPISYTEIGRVFGSKNHATVITACCRVEERRARDPATQRATDQIARVFGITLE